ncbi:hypothetical protein MSG28_003766 [Choristoneura fumiferana]|uniref:Uncharacterized protein n=1 Tax=Choristoneura fumiferana TaxID=7141 RepID=A0ACC0KGA8_CHOFU|nr:hypothetical protein MSG28_003766 [Choristoneura fumiferana]
MLCVVCYSRQWRWRGVAACRWLCALVLARAALQRALNVCCGTLGRVVIFILFLAFLFLYTAYSASIVVLLQSSSNQIRTLSDLLQSKLELGVEDTPYNRFWFFACNIKSVQVNDANFAIKYFISVKTTPNNPRHNEIIDAKDPIRKAIYEKKIAPKGSTPRFYSMDEGIKLLQNKPFAFNTNLGVGYRFMEKYFHEHEKCGLQEIAFIQDGSAWSSCYKLSPYKEIFKVGLLRIQEHGLATRVNHLIYVKKPVCAVRGGRFVSVSIVDFYPSLLVLLYGLVLAVVLLDSTRTGRETGQGDKVASERPVAPAICSKAAQWSGSGDGKNSRKEEGLQ